MEATISASHSIIGAVVRILHDTVDADFTHYKLSTLHRRISRRIVLHKLDGFREYVTFLEANAGEAEALCQDILVDATGFFRDPEAFEALKNEVFPVLAERRSRGDPVRIWTPGCSTGEEPYSLAMAFAEFAGNSGKPLPVRIFATDLNAASLDQARVSAFSRSAVHDVSPGRLARFFVERNGGYSVVNAIRETCVFTPHDVIADPPFPGMDLVACRNVLIYFDAQLQRRTIPRLHQALRPGGFLWLGSSETVGPHRDLFELKQAQHRIYAKRPAVRRAQIDDPGPSRMPNAASIVLGVLPADTREYMQAVIDQQQKANEELRAANAELQRVNEDLQSINEQLRASQNVLESSNDHLTIVNDELRAHNAELARSNNDLLSLLAIRTGLPAD